MAEDGLVIAAAEAAQAAAIAALWAETGLTTWYNDPVVDLARASGKWNSEVLTGTIGGRVVASVMVGHDGHRGWLYYVAVAPEAQHRGYGARLVAAGEAWLRERGIPKVQLLIRETNSAVRGFYEHLGYERSPVTVMQKWLTPPE